MDENEIDRMAEELFEPFSDFAENLSLDDAFSLAEALEIRFSDYQYAIQDDLRRSR